MQVHPLLRVAIGATLSMALTLAAVAVSAQTWEYKSYKKKGLGGNFDPNQFVIGTVTLEEKDGKATLAMNAGTMDACRRGEMPAAVTRGPSTVASTAMAMPTMPNRLPRRAVSGLERPPRLRMNRMVAPM